MFLTNKDVLIVVNDFSLLNNDLILLQGVQSMAFHLFSYLEEMTITRPMNKGKRFCCLRMLVIFKC